MCPESIRVALGFDFFVGGFCIMSRLLAGALCSASLAALCVPTAASAAITVSGSVTGTSVRDLDPGLVLAATPLAFADFTLANVGDTHTTDVLRIGTNESSVDFDDLFLYPVSATFAFSSPMGAGGTATGSSSGFIRILTSCGLLAGGCGRVSWNNPTIFNFGNGGAFSVTLSNVEFATPGAANVSARFELLANAVPEPSTWALLILGFGGVGAAMRAQRRTRASIALA